MNTYTRIENTNEGRALSPRQRRKYAAHKSAVVAIDKAGKTVVVVGKARFV